MARAKTKLPSPAGDEETHAVDAFLAALKHPRRTEIERVRQLILRADPGIGEAVKWRAPSFRTTEFFATINLRSSGPVQIIFHLGAKVRTRPRAMKIADTSGMIKWLARDRCLVTVGSIATQGGALQDIVRQWIRYV